MSEDVLRHGEIRLNDLYTTHCISEYKDADDLQSDSKPVITKRHLRTNEFIKRLKSINKNDKKCRRTL